MKGKSPRLEKRSHTIGSFSPTILKKVNTKELNKLLLKRQEKTKAPSGGKISRNSDGSDMHHITKAALGISNKFGLLNKHRSLVIAHTEEKKVQEALFKLVLARVNSSTSFLRWATEEKNQDLKENICRLYDINLMWATVQKTYIEENSALMMSLKDILQIEAGLDALQKHLKEVTEKRERLQQRKSDGVRKKLEKSETVTDEIAKLIDEEESLTSELEVKTLKAEIFKGRSLKTALKKVTEAHLQLSEKMKLIFQAMEKVVDDIQEIPEYLKVKKTTENDVPEMIPTEEDIVGDLAQQLEINRPSSVSSLTRNLDNKRPSATFYVDPAQNGVKLNMGNGQQKPIPQKKTSGAKITFGFKKMFGLGNSPSGNLSGDQGAIPQVPKRNDLMSTFNTDFVMVSGNSPPRLPPPDLQLGVRRRSKSNVMPPTFVRKMEQKKGISEASDTDDEEDYVMPNADYLPKESFSRSRSKSESKLDNTGSDYGYSRPWDLPRSENTSQYDFINSDSSGERSKYSYAYQHFLVNQRPQHDDPYGTYQNPKDCLQQAGLEDIYTEFNGGIDGSGSDGEGLYDSPYDMREQVAELHRQHELKKRMSAEEFSDDDDNEEDIYENSLKLLDDIEYIDPGELRKIQSRPDASSGQIIVEQKSPIPIPRRDYNVDNARRGTLDKKDISSPVILEDHPSMKGRKVIPIKPVPSPRPNAKFYDIPPPKPPHSQQFISDNAQDFRNELKSKIRPVSSILSVTQTNLSNDERLQYENNNVFR